MDERDRTCWSCSMEPACGWPNARGSLSLEHLDLQRSQLLVQLGKGQKDRHLPLGPALLARLQIIFATCAPPSPRNARRMLSS